VEFLENMKNGVQIWHNLLQDMKSMCTIHTLPSCAQGTESFAHILQVQAKKIQNKLQGSTALCYERTTWQQIIHIFGMLGLVSSQHPIFDLYSEPNECSPHISHLCFQDAFQFFHLWLCLPSSLFFQDYNPHFKRGMETTR